MRYYHHLCASFVKAKVLKSEAVLSEGNPPAIDETGLSGSNLEPRSRGKEQDNTQGMINEDKRAWVIILEDNRFN